MKKNEYHTIEPSTCLYGSGKEVVVYAWGKYESSSVLAGQNKKTYIEEFDSAELALKAFPNALALEGIAEAGNTFGHLPDAPDDDYISEQTTIHDPTAPLNVAGFFYAQTLHNTYTVLTQSKTYY